MKIKCHKCGYEQNTKSKMFQVSCSRCGAKVKIKENIEKFKKVKGGD